MAGKKKKKSGKKGDKESPSDGPKLVSTRFLELV